VLHIAFCHLAHHDSGVAVKESNARQTLALLEAVNYKRLARLENNGGDLVGLEGMRVVKRLSTGLLPLLHLEFSDATGGTSASDEANGGVTNLNLTGDVQGLDLSGEIHNVTQSGVRLENHHIARTRHIVFLETLDVHSDVVTGLGRVHALVVHLDSENLASARISLSVRGHEQNLIVGLHNSLLYATGKHITNTLDLVDTGDRETEIGGEIALRLAAHVVQGL